MISGFFAYLQARSDVAANPVPRGLPTRALASGAGRGADAADPHAAADSHPGRGRRADHRAAHPSGPGDGRRDGARRATSLPGGTDARDLSRTAPQLPDPAPGGRDGTRPSKPRPGMRSTRTATSHTGAPPNHNYPDRRDEPTITGWDGPAVV
jgi:hypothetical protein